MGSTAVSAVVTAHDRTEFLAEAVRSALEGGADEVVVVRNFSSPISGAEGRYRSVDCPAEETGVKQALGLEAAHGDVVAFLDDDDTWVPAKVPRVRELFGADPALVYYDHGQQPVDVEGRPVIARHREWAEKDPARLGRWDGNDIPEFFDRIWPGNNSSTVVRRDWALRWTRELRDAGWASDRFWVVAALLDHARIRLDADPLTRLRLHERNMSQPRSTTPGEFRQRHATSSARFARATGTLARMSAERVGATAPLAVYFRASATAFDFFAAVERGPHARRAALRALRSEVRRFDRAAFDTALIAVVSPGLARRALYRSGQRRWRIERPGTVPPGGDAKL